MSLGARTPRTYFATKWWRSRGVVQVTARLDEYGYISNHGLPGKASDWVYGKLGGSLFETREAANDAVKKKAAAAAKRLRKELARIEAIANGGAP